MQIEDRRSGVVDYLNAVLELYPSLPRAARTLVCEWLVRSAAAPSDAFTSPAAPSESDAGPASPAGALAAPSPGGGSPSSPSLETVSRCHAERQDSFLSLIHI